MREWLNTPGNRPGLAIVGVALVLIVLGANTLRQNIIPSSPRAGLCAATTNPDHYITRNGPRLMIDGQRFCFAGANIYWLGMDQNEHGNFYPSAYRVTDALATAYDMGARVIRSHTLGISVGCDLCLEPSLGVFNPMAFQHIDSAIAAARAQRLRLIIPLVDNYHYYHGGKHTFTDWRGLPESAFYTDPTVINDFETYIRTLLTHVNAQTGLALIDDPTILAWETGNELTAPASWTATIATYIKSLDPHHLVMDGTQIHGRSPAETAADLAIPAIDIYTTHYYGTLPELAADARLAATSGKAFIVGEFDWTTNGLSRFLATATATQEVSGDLYWSLFGHADQYGYIPHDDGYTLHYPGDTPQMRQAVVELRAQAYAMLGEAYPPPAAAPGTPSITALSATAANALVIAWRGGWGAATYSIEAATAGPNGPWTVVCNQCVTDNSAPYHLTGVPSGRAWYRLRGFSDAGLAGNYSTPIQQP